MKINKLNHILSIVKRVIVNCENLTPDYEFKYKRLITGTVNVKFNDDSFFMKKTILNVIIKPSENIYTFKKYSVSSYNITTQQYIDDYLYTDLEENYFNLSTIMDINIIDHLFLVQKLNEFISGLNTNSSFIIHFDNLFKYYDSL